MITAANPAAPGTGPLGVKGGKEKAMSSDPKLDLLRHTVATLAYRGCKVVRGASPDFAAFAGAGRTPAQILAHIGDLLDWGLSMAEGKQRWQNSEPLPWDKEAGRFFACLQAFDGFLASGNPCAVPAERLFQGPIADALTHVGQIAMMRRLAGVPIKGENYFEADIAAGTVGAEQAAPAREF
jgi:hypothetical protein